jgi:transcriptional regulator with XRE-family HTH domain
MAIDPKLGEEIACIRKSAGMLSKDLAARAGLTQSQLSKIERGKRRCSPEELKLVAEALELPVGIFLGDPYTDNLDDLTRQLVAATTTLDEYAAALNGIPRWIRSLCRLLP